ncbi:MAG: hypothetical protein K5857_05725 [Lachnospiraceae bacterium]|nr:hypothetical protein [Lachnospiraceae bacterium]
MTSKSSSWVNLIENNKRRVWQWCVSILLLVVVNSVLLLLLLMSIDESRYIADYGARAVEMIRRDVANYCEFAMGASAFKVVVTTILGIMLAWGGYTYINDKVKLDFYEAVPVKRGNRFSTIWLSGIIMYSGTYIIGTLLCFAMATITGFGDVYTMEQALVAFVKMFLYFMGVYHLFILAMMLTGTAFAGVCAFLFLSFFELAVRGLIGIFRSVYFVYDYVLGSFYTPVFSPYGLLFRMSDKTYLLTGGSEVKCLIEMIVLDLVLLVLSYILYMKRPVEKAGKTLAFKGLAPLLKILIGSLVVAYASLFTLTVLNRTRDLSVKDMGAVALMCVITSIIVCAIMEAVFELDIKAAFKRKIYWLICAVAGLAIFFGFKIDFFNIDRYVPDPGKVASVVFAPEGYEDNYSYLDPEEGTLPDYQYWLKNMYLNDVESVSTLARLSIGRYDEAVKTVGSEDDIYQYGDGDEFSTAVVMYRMKNGRIITRKINVPVNDPEAVDLLDTIMSNSTFVNSYFGVMAYDLDKVLPDDARSYGGSSSFTDGIRTIKLTNSEVKDLIRLYRTDMDKYSFKARRDLWPVGFLDYEIRESNEPGYRFYYGGSGQTIAIFPDMENCMKFLKDKGYDPTDMDLAIAASGIEITNSHYDEQNEYAKEQGLEYLPDELAQDFVKTRVYDREVDASVFDDIAGVIVPNERGYWRWDGGISADYDYEVRVYFGSASTEGADFRNGASYCFLEGSVPEFVEQALKL